MRTSPAYCTCVIMAALSRPDSLTGCMIWAQLQGIPKTMRWPVKVVTLPLVTAILIVPGTGNSKQPSWIYHVLLWKLKIVELFFFKQFILNVQLITFSRKMTFFIGGTSYGRK
ncbi:uncharacterized protein LOC132716488 [Ruditapes philippinarum]|uniref:uncharacterized protein LOC132716488 n=1 Tax=Ruditapes philippinarum TaxID=129788 RepID=UPI00295B0030|nr:uncharacterized protein LOC132716488 [Ruditapes philippinarum]